MKKTLIILTIAFVITAPGVAGAQGPQTGDFSAQVKTFFNDVFQGDYNKTQPAETDVSGRDMPVTQRRGAPAEEKGTGSAGSPEYNLPYCESADVDKHYSLASEYIQDRFDDYSVDRDSNHQVGPCNNGNTAWTAFDVVNKEGNVVGEVTVNGDTEEVTFSGSEPGEAAPAPSPSPGNKGIVTEVGETFSISLEANPSTGHRWEASYNEEMVNLIDKEFISDQPVEPEEEVKRTGVPGKRIFKFRALSTGKTDINFQLRSPSDEIVKKSSYRISIYQENRVCCKVYGVAKGEEVNVHYEWRSKEECSVPPGFTGGGRDVINDKYCTDRGRTAPAPSPGGSAPIEYDRGRTAPAEAEPGGSVTEPIPGTPAESETSEGRITIFDRIKGVFKKKATPQGPGEFRPADEAQVSEEVRVKLEQKREEVREKIQISRDEVEAIREEAMQRVQEKKQEFMGEVQAIQDRQKRVLAERIHDKLFGIRENTLENFSETLDQLNSVAGNITTRVEKSAAEGVSTKQVENAVNNAESKINSARQAVKNVFQKDYAVQNASDLQALRNEFRSFRDELKSDLLDARNMVREAHRATRSAAEELTQTIESE